MKKIANSSMHQQTVGAVRERERESHTFTNVEFVYSTTHGYFIKP